MCFTPEQKVIIRAHCDDMARKVLVFQQLVEIDIVDESKKCCFLSLVDKVEEEIAEIKNIVLTLED